MSELKVINAYLPTFDADHNEMLLVSHTKENYVSAKQIQCYLKSEADKVIAEKDKELRHQKYKRCLAMARWCNRMFSITFGKERYWQKWNRRWLELAQTLKEAK